MYFTKLINEKFNEWKSEPRYNKPECVGDYYVIECVNFFEDELKKIKNIKSKNSQVDFKVLEKYFMLIFNIDFNKIFHGEMSKNKIKFFLSMMRKIKKVDRQSKWNDIRIFDFVIDSYLSKYSRYQLMFDVIMGLKDLEKSDKEFLKPVKDYFNKLNEHINKTF